MASCYLDVSFGMEHFLIFLLFQLLLAQTVKQAFVKMLILLAP